MEGSAHLWESFGPFGSPCAQVPRQGAARSKIPEAGSAERAVNMSGSPGGHGPLVRTSTGVKQTQSLDHSLCQSTIWPLWLEAMVAWLLLTQHDPESNGQRCRRMMLASLRHPGRQSLRITTVMHMHTQLAISFPGIFGHMVLHLF